MKAILMTRKKVQILFDWRQIHFGVSSILKPNRLGTKLMLIARIYLIFRNVDSLIKVDANKCSLLIKAALECTLNGRYI